MVVRCSEPGHVGIGAGCSDECTASIDDYLTAIKVMALSICDWCGVEDR